MPNHAEPSAGRPKGTAGARSNHQRNALRSTAPARSHRERNQRSAFAAVWSSTPNVQRNAVERESAVADRENPGESGMSISVSYNPTPSTPLGFTARVSPAWGGDVMSGAEALWGRESMAGMGNDPLMNGGGQRLDTEVGYGMPIGSRFVGTPRAGVRTSEYGRDYRIGYGMQVLEQGKLNLQLGVDAERRESPLFQMQEQEAGTDQRVLGRATVQW